MNYSVAKLFITITAGCLFAFCRAGANTYGSTDKIYVDTLPRKYVIVHHHFDAGVLCRVGRDRVRTYDDYDHSTTSADNYILGEYSRFITARMAHGIVFKKVFEAGVTYGADVYVQPHDVRAFVPLMVHVMNNTRINNKLGLLFIERCGYAFYIRSRNTDEFLKYPGVEGGFTSETLAGVSIRCPRRNYLQILLGYKLQHIYNKAVFYPDQSLIQQGGAYANLPARITETSNGLYHLLYLSLGVPF